ncbi:MAG: Rieske (2Fe-2S) protein [Myxococcales bacterium]|nr:Rieske (2Fe-2S) protein [Myxococcales bacterium]
MGHEPPADDSAAHAAPAPDDADDSAAHPAPAPDDAGGLRDAGESMPAAPSTSRRRVLGVLVGVGSSAYAASLAIPAARFLSGGAGPAATSGDAHAASFIRVARLESLRDGVPERVRVRGDRRDAFTLTRELTLGSVWLRKAGDALLAFSAECPHLGCAVALDDGGASFGCPCHTSRFLLDGSAASGPSPRGMDPLATRVVDGWVEVAFKRFRQGTTERESIG